MSHRTIRTGMVGMLALISAAGLVLAANMAIAHPPRSTSDGSAVTAAARQERTDKETAIHLLDQIVNQGNLDVIDEVVLPDYIEHNPQGTDGAAALRERMTAARQRYPQMSIEIARSLQDGDIVLVHSNVILTPGTRGTAVVDMYRFTDGMIAEHWDVVQDVPERTASGNDMFTTVSPPEMNEPDPTVDTETSREIATAMFTELTVGRDVTALDRYCDPRYFQHNPAGTNGLAAVRAIFAAVLGNPGFTVDTRRIVVEHDYVAIHSLYKFSANERGNVVFDLYRVRDGKVLEHWDVSQPWPANSTNPHPMF